MSDERPVELAMFHGSPEWTPLAVGLHHDVITHGENR